MKVFWLLIAGIVAAALAVLFGVVPGTSGDARDPVPLDDASAASVPSQVQTQAALTPERGVSWQSSAGESGGEPVTASSAEDFGRSTDDAAHARMEPDIVQRGEGGAVGAAGVSASPVTPSFAVAGAVNQQSLSLVAPGHVHQVPVVPEPVAADVGRDLDALLGIAPESEEEAAAHAERLQEAQHRALQELSDRYGIIAGEGTRERPYRIDWERLASASRVYRPREGLLELPSFIRKLDGAFVELAGYTLFSWSGLQIDEILLTRYMWDGCCIGVPPTPFTAVETRLKEPIERKDVWAMRSGIFVGRFQVDPYVQGDWLIALYVMEDAEMQPVF